MCDEEKHYREKICYTDCICLPIPSNRFLIHIPRRDNISADLTVATLKTQNLSLEKFCGFEKQENKITERTPYSG